MPLNVVSGCQLPSFVISRPTRLECTGFMEATKRAVAKRNGGRFPEAQDSPATGSSMQLEKKKKNVD